MPELFAAVPRTSTSQAIGDQIKRLITDRRLVAGDTLPPERELAASFGVSRTTLREALRALTEKGIVVGRHGSGWVVHPDRATAAANLEIYFRLENVTFEQVIEARLANEPAIARLAAERRTEQELAAIAAACDAMDAVAAPREFLDADTRFHELIAAAAHNPVLSFQLHPTMSLLEHVRLAVVAAAPAVSASQDEHRRIVAAIAAADAAAAERAMREHITTFADRGRPTAAALGR